MLDGPETFDCDGDSHSLGYRWEKWKRGLQLYLLASAVETPEKKRATLLHTGGLGLQEIYYNIPGADAEPKDNEGKEVDVYEIAVKKLDEYFSPKQSYVYERHTFRLIKQEEGEKFEKFLVRLRNQSSKCKFKDDDNLIDQITEKCRSAELRKKILTLGDAATVDKIITEANTLETVERQLTDFQKEAPKDLINKIEAKQKRFQGNKFNSTTGCTRCGSRRHKADCTTCPAKDQICKKCGFKGHFKKMCRTRPYKRRLNATSEGKAGKDPEPDKKKSKIEKNTTIDYIFNMDEGDTVKCEIGGVDVDILIDSGSKCNIITDTTWNRLKANAIQVTSQDKSVDRVFMAYGSKEPLTALGRFEANIRMGSEEQEATFYVIKDGPRDLLGKDTAILLNVLKMGAVPGQNPSSFRY
ncbi:uncharacterized protein LOC134744451 isoform X2 [Cydia strobilella]|uniref:uncharacterized protein LOC134744451 isoform X2 n=1 Tax=Cydia strobilella TaxID=1100964 RepID=UPI003004DC38